MSERNSAMLILPLCVCVVMRKGDPQKKGGKEEKIWSAKTMTKKIQEKNTVTKNKQAAFDL